MQSTFIYWILIAVVSFSLSNVTQARDSDSDRLIIYTVNYPLKYFAERIAGEHAKVVFPAPPGIDPAFWMPDAKTINVYQRADVILLNGAGYAKWVNKVSLPQLRLVNTSAVFKDRYIKINKTVTHSHGPGGDHSHAGTTFTTWLDFSQAAQQAKAIMHVLSKKLPEHKADFENNYTELEKDLLTLDAEIKAMVSMKHERPLMASHPVYQYFTRRYGLNLESVMWEPDHLPNQAEWAALKNRLRHHPAKWMIWESEPLPESVERLRSMGVNSLVINPSGNRPAEDDFISMMRRNLGNLKAAFEPQPGSLE